MLPRVVIVGSGFGGLSAVRALRNTPVRVMIIPLVDLRVECYSGGKADERPIQFCIDGTHYRVEAVLDQWYDTESLFYKVRADDGNLYILRQWTSTPEGEWELVSFRQAG